MDSLLSATSVAIWTAAAGAVVLAGFAAAAPEHAVAFSLGRIPLPNLIGGHFSIGVRVEPVNAALLVLITVVAGIVAAFCARNLPGQHRTPRFSVLQIIVVLSLALCVTASSLPLLALGWMVAGLAVSGLVEHAGSKASKGAASLVRARLLLGDAALWVGIGFLGNAIGSLDIEDLFAFSANANPVDPASTSMTVAAFLLIVGGGVRSTLYPFHDWLPETAEAPTPVSALLHAGIVNGIGVLGLLLWPVFATVRSANYFLLVLGVFTALVGTSQTRVRADIKGRLAASTTSQMGYLSVQIALGLPAAALTHLVGHGLWKAGLFLQAGGAIERVRAAADHPIHALSNLRWTFGGILSALIVFGADFGPYFIFQAPFPLNRTNDVVPLIVAWFTGTCALAATSGVLPRLAIAAMMSLYIFGVQVMERVVGYLTKHDGSETPLWSFEELCVVTSLVSIGGLAVFLDRKMREGGLPWLAGLVALSSMPRMGLEFDLFRDRLSVPANLRVIGKRKLTGGKMPTDAFVTDMNEAMKHLAPVWPLTSFVASNPLANLEDLSFRDALKAASTTWSCQTGPDGHIMRKAADEGRIGLMDAMKELEKEAGLSGVPAEVRIAGRSVSRDEFLSKLVLGGTALPPTAKGRLAELVDAHTDLGHDLAPLFPNYVRTPLEALAASNPELRPYDDLARTFGTLLASRVHGDPAWPAGGVLRGTADGVWDAFRFRAATGGVDTAISVKGAGAMVCKLPADATEALELLLEELVGSVPIDRISILARYLVREPGWPAHAAWRTRQGVDPKGGVVEILAVRVALEAAVILAFRTKRTYGMLNDDPESQPLILEATGLELEVNLDKARTEAIERLFQACEALALDPADLRSGDVSSLIAFIASVDQIAVGQVRFRLLEESFRGRLVSGIHRHLGSAPQSTSPQAQFVTCIDVRSERLRRHLERINGAWETMGAAGFFGLAVRHVGPKGACSDRCPALLFPNREVIESAHDAPLQVTAKKSAIEEIETKAVAPFAFAEAAGWVTGPLSLLRTLLPTVWNGFFGETTGMGEMPLENDKKRDARTIGITNDGVMSRLPGFQVEELVNATEGLLRTTGFSDGNFSPLIVLCGHGAAAPNNPHVAAYDCGACGGFPGDVSARAVCTALNSPTVRAGLASRGIDIPETTHFTPAIHDTTRDLVHFLAQGEVPSGLLMILDKLKADLSEACDRTLMERFPGLPGAPSTNSIGAMRRHVNVRAVDWGQPRPEWGLGANGSIVIGPRHLTSHLDLEGRVFMQSYDPSTDPTLSSLAFLMTAPLVVGHWISSQYLMSTIDPGRFGAGDKTMHDVVCSHDMTPSILTGVLTGVRGDLQIGLPWQGLSTVAPIDGKWVAPTYHEPIRLFGVIYATPANIDKVLAEQESIRKLVEGAWVAVCSIDPETRAMMRRKPEGGWEVENAAKGV